MKARLFVVSVLAILSVSCLALASQQQGECSGVYTIGEVSYDKSLENGNPSIKLGPIPVDQVPPVFPKSFWSQMVVTQEEWFIVALKRQRWG